MKMSGLLFPYPDKITLLQQLESEQLDLTFWKRLSGETVGVLIAMTAIAFLQWLQNRRLQ
jgi:hypothetical protein